MLGVQIQVNLPGSKLLSLSVSTGLSYESVQRVMEVVQTELGPHLDPTSISDLGAFLKPPSSSCPSSAATPSTLVTACSSAPKTSKTKRVEPAYGAQNSASGGAIVKQGSTSAREVILSCITFGTNVAIFIYPWW